MTLTKEYKWTYYRVVEGMYTILPPEKIRSRCGVNYIGKVFPDLASDLEKLGIDVTNYPRFHPETEYQVGKALTIINHRWAKYLEEEIKKKNGV